MKFVFLGYDYTLDIAHRLIDDGHELVRIFTFPCDNVFAFNIHLHDFAKQHDIPVSEDNITAQDIEALTGQGVELFLCAGYPHKIPPVLDKAYGINVHPTFLPRARGIMPLPYVIMQDRGAAGFSVHKLTDAFDTGDILYQKQIPLEDDTDVETLSARIALCLPDVLSDIVSNIEKYWHDAVVQDDTKASSYPMPENSIRRMNWTESVDALLLKGRAFGRFGMMATIRNDAGQSQNLAVFQFTGWIEAHDHKPGTLMRSSPREVVVAVKDGFLCLKEFQVLE